MKKKLSLFLVSILSSLIFVSCGNTNETKIDKSNKEVKEISFAVPDGIPAIAIAKIIKEKPAIDENYNVNYTIEQSSDTLTTNIMKGEPDVAVVPSNVAAIAYNKNKEYKIAGTVGWGSFYIGSADPEVTSIEGLKEREVYNIGKGLTPDIITRCILNDKGIDADKDINFSYVDGVTELAPAILSGKTKYAVIPEPALTTVQSKDENFKVIADLNSEWKTINNSEYGYPQSTLIIKSDLIENDKDFVDKLLKEVSESCEWVYGNKETLGDYCEEIGVSAKKPVIVNSVDRTSIKYVDIKDCAEEYNTYFKKLNKFEPKTVGGSIPDDKIYMEK